MRGRLFVGAFTAAILTLVLAAPVSAHGDHDARPLARQLAAGPYVISLWQVYADASVSMTPHLIVMFDGGPAVSTVSEVRVEVNSTPMTVVPSTTTVYGWETTQGSVEGDVVKVTVSDGTQAWDAEPVVVPPPPTSMLPMRELVIGAIIFTAVSACWVVGRATRGWRKPALQARLSKRPLERGGSS